ncbi:MAG: hypothetical protein AAFZ65_05570 [Planctomycetota bacterium]
MKFKLTLKSASTAALGLTLAGLVASCGSTRPATLNHWNGAYALKRVNYQFTGYRGGIDGGFFAFLGAELATISTTTSRHFLNYNPSNPFQNGTVDRESVARPPKPERFKVKNDRSPQRIF